MIIKLRRAISPEDLAEKERGICGVRYRVEEGVVIEAMIGSPGVEVGQACEECLRYLAERNPGSFPSWEDYQYAAQINAPPIFESEEAIIRAQDEGTYGEAFAASWIR